MNDVIPSIISPVVHCENVFLSLLTRSWLDDITEDFGDREHAVRKKGRIMGVLGVTSQPDAEETGHVRNEVTSHETCGIK